MFPLKKSVHVLMLQTHYKNEAILSNCEISLVTTISRTVGLTSISSFYMFHTPVASLPVADRLKLKTCHFPWIMLLKLSSKLLWNWLQIFHVNWIELNVLMFFYLNYEILCDLFKNVCALNKPNLLIYPQKHQVMGVINVYCILKNKD